MKEKPYAQQDLNPLGMEKETSPAANSLLNQSNYCLSQTHLKNKILFF